nr:MAG TPA: hypothetical protein [Caudoviricetes sp.]
MLYMFSSSSTKKPSYSLYSFVLSSPFCRFM